MTIIRPWLFPIEIRRKYDIFSRQDSESDLRLSHTAKKERPFGAVTICYTLIV
jgi:hypothetical protein